MHCACPDPIWDSQKSCKALVHQTQRATPIPLPSTCAACTQPACPRASSDLYHQVQVQEAEWPRPEPATPACPFTCAHSAQLQCLSFSQCKKHTSTRQGFALMCKSSRTDMAEHGVRQRGKGSPCAELSDRCLRTFPDQRPRAVLRHWAITKEGEGRGLTLTQGTHVGAHPSLAAGFYFLKMVLMQGTEQCSLRSTYTEQHVHSTVGRPAHQAHFSPSPNL